MTTVNALAHDLRKQATPTSPIGILCNEAADRIEKAEELIRSARETKSWDTRDHLLFEAQHVLRKGVS